MSDQLRNQVTDLIHEATTDSSAASSVTDRILALFPTTENPWLGQASNGQLLEELRARAAITNTLNYRPVESD